MATGNASPANRHLAVLLIAVALCYVHGYYESFVFDDINLIERNESIRSLDYLPGLVGLGGEKVPTHRVVRTLTYALDYQLWGTNAKGYHLTNLLIHLLNVVLVLKIGSLLWPSGPTPFLAALLWGIHPVQTEAVTYLSGRRDVLSALFYLWAVFLYLRWRCGHGSPRHLAGCLAAYAIGCFTKEVTVTVPGVIGAYELVRFFKDRSVEAAKLPDGTGPGFVGALLSRVRDLVGGAPLFFGLLALFPLAFTAYIFKLHPFNYGQYYVTRPLPTDLLSLAKFGVHYLWLLIFPKDLSIDYFPESLSPSTGLLEPATLGALAVHLALAVVLIRFTWRGSKAAFAGLWFVVTFLPMSNLFFSSNEPVAEHYLYLPSVGFFWAVALGVAAIQTLRPDWTPLVNAFVVVAALGLAFRTDGRNREWEDPVRIYRSSLSVFPRNSRLMNNLACYYLGRQDYEKALPLLDASMKLSPRENLYHYNKALALRKLGLFKEAHLEYQEALRGAPHYVDAMMGLAFNQILLKDFRGALSTYEHALHHVGDRAWYIHHWRGVALRELGDFARSREEFQAALKLGHRHPETLWQLALAIAAQARTRTGEPRGRAGRLRSEAEQLLEEAVAAAPESAVLRGTLGDLYRESGDLARALEQYTAMGLANEEYTAESALRRARVHRQTGDRAKALEAYRAALSFGFADKDLEGYLGLSSSSSANRSVR
ncbi:MAG: tetratricopeptide repeat protein [Candidatus Riflebacteria bacterium]|nr:tetratricopeptide repeat protein [Candidatus Riflebacteria bacterium]